MPKTKATSLWLLAVPAVLICYATLAVVIRLWYPSGLSHDKLQLHIIHFSIIYVLWVIVLFMHNAFELQSLRSNTRLVFNLISAMAVNLLVAALYFYFQPNLSLTPRRFLLAHVAITLVLLVVWQLLVKYFLGHRLIEHLHLYVDGEEPQDFIDELSKHKVLGFHIAGMVTASELPQLANRQIKIVIPDASALSPETLRQFYDLRRQAVTFYNYKTLYELVSRKIYLSSLSELWFLENITYSEKRFYSFAKRIVDFLVGLVGGIITLILFPFIGLAIKLETRGPVLFKQRRVGKYGTIIIVNKFRTMRQGVDNTWTDKGDSRITGIGKFLRRSRLDELPQSLNLLKGDMSLVGPRPEQPHIVDDLRSQIPFYDERHLVKPGITGWGQLNVYARTVEESKTKLQYDLYYIKHRSLLFDLEIILKTLYHVLTSSDT